MEATRFLPLLGRVLIGLPFLVSGLGKLAAFGPTTAYIGGVDALGAAGFGDCHHL